MPSPDDLPILAFATAPELREWLVEHHATSPGIWVQIAKAGTGVPSVTFHELLDEGLCFGWSESMRRRGDATHYLQRFTPRRRKGTTSARNRARVEALIAAGRMTEAGLRVL